MKIELNKEKNKINLFRFSIIVKVILDIYYTIKYHSLYKKAMEHFYMVDVGYDVTGISQRIYNASLQLYNKMIGNIHYYSCVYLLLIIINIIIFVLSYVLIKEKRKLKIIRIILLAISILEIVFYIYFIKKFL